MAENKPGTPADEPEDTATKGTGASPYGLRPESTERIAEEVSEHTAAERAAADYLRAEASLQRTVTSAVVEEAAQQAQEEAEFQRAVAMDLQAASPGPGLLRRSGAEFFGTMAMMLFGVGSVAFAFLALTAAQTQTQAQALFGAVNIGNSSLVIALGFGVGMAVAVAAVGHISGGHFNPAITIGAAMSGRLSWKDLPAYWLAQLLGALAGVGVLYIVLMGRTWDGGGSVTNLMQEAANTYGADTSVFGFSLTAALLAEVIVTAVLVFVVLGVTSRKADSRIAPLVIGGALGVATMVLIPVTNASMNPAHSTATAVFAGFSYAAIKQLWLFWVAPLVGGALAGLIYPALGGFESEDAAEEIAEALAEAEEDAEEVVAADDQDEALR